MDSAMVFTIAIDVDFFFSASSENDSEEHQNKRIGGSGSFCIFPDLYGSFQIHYHFIIQTFYTNGTLKKTNALSVFCGDHIGPGPDGGELSG